MLVNCIELGSYLRLQEQQMIYPENENKIANGRKIDEFRFEVSGNLTANRCI